jgi:aminocarboxymuconate-semialdehyde decarboxylase
LDQAPVSEAVEIALSFNEEMADAQRRYPGRFFGTACIPLQDTDKAVSVLDHAVKELDLRGVNLPAITDDELIDVERLEPFYARVEELGIPLIVHPTDIVFQDVLKGYGGALHSTIGRLLDSSVTVLRLIFSGVLERYPELKVMHTHAGGLLPYQAGRIDKNSRQVKLERPPSEYLKQIYVDTVAPQALTIKTAIEYYGIDRVVYGTDYPCWSPAEALQVIEDCQLSSTEKETILRTNAAKLLNI